MTDVPGKSLAAFSEAEAAIEPYRAGGIIDRAIGAPEGGMDRIIGEHLGNVALLNARGDTVQERPTYIFNPDTGLLINYAYRRDSNPARAGFFADVVELDEAGKPRHGVGIVNPFATKTGFINVGVGENNKGFAPSSVRLNFENEDPTSVVPPNIEMADLLNMLQSEPIPDDMDLRDFQARQQAAQTEMRGRVQEKHTRNYLSTDQAMTSSTDANLHLIISDREDTFALESASRSVGVFPVVLSAYEVVAAGMDMRRMGAPDEDMLKLRSYVDLRSERNAVREALTKSVPAFVTTDFEYSGGANDERWQKKMVNFSSVDADRPTQVDTQVAVQRLFHGSLRGNKGVMESNPIFSRLSNERFYVDGESPDEVTKTSHGKYELAIDPSIPENLKTYTDWLRKIRLDFALTLYLRGLSQL